MNDFETWWHNEGSDPKRFNEDWEEHCKRMCQIAWSNGALKEREDCAKVCEEPGWNAANWCAKAIRKRGEL
jgi:hypothetical protein